MGIMEVIDQEAAVKDVRQVYILHSHGEGTSCGPKCCMHAVWCSSYAPEVKKVVCLQGPSASAPLCSVRENGTVYGIGGPDTSKWVVSIAEL
jgi:hypothetical protein